MKVKDIMSKIRNVCWVMFHKDGGSKNMSIDELETEDLEQEFSWFEVTTFNGKHCIEFNFDVVNKENLEKCKKSSGYDLDFHYRCATTSADHEEFRRMFGRNPF